MTDALLDQIEQALRGAIPGPWDTMDEKVFSVTPVNGLPWLVCETPYDYDSGDEEQHLRNAHLIAHAPEWLQALVGRLRRSEQERAALREANAKLSDFFRTMWDGARGVGPTPDGADIQDRALELGLLAPHEVTAPCCEGCVCEEFDGIPGTCFRPTDLVGVGSPTGAPQP